MIRLTQKYRIKDAVSRRALKELASSVNFVWNYINDLSFKYFKRHRGTDTFPFLSAYDLHGYTKGTSKELKLSAQTIQAICEFHVTSRKTAKRAKLAWRSMKRSLGWIPFKSSNIRISDDRVTYLKREFKIYRDRASLRERASRMVPSMRTLGVDGTSTSRSSVLRRSTLILSVKLGSTLE